jgi:UDP-glucose 6-dehydrogenase
MILVIGCGFVGEAVAQSLEENDVAVMRIDPKHNSNKIEDYIDVATRAIVSVPTPTLDGKCDDSIVRSVLEQLGSLPVLLKSTVPFSLLATYSDSVTYNPEFLRAKTAKEDFDNQTVFILGGSQMQCYKWEQVFNYLPHVEFIYTDRTTASMTKYVHNNWLALKVAFFHELYYNMGNEYNHESMINILSKFENIGPSHMAAPNDEGKLGYGGHCFPKDTEAFFDFSNSEIIKQVIETNKNLRGIDDNPRND